MKPKSTVDDEGQTEAWRRFEQRCRDDAAHRRVSRLEIEILRSSGADLNLDSAFLAWVYSAPPGRETWNSLVAALKKIPARTNSGGEEFVGTIASSLAHYATLPPIDAAGMRALRRSSAKTTKANLKKLERDATKLVRTIDALRRPGIEALEQVGFEHLYAGWAVVRAMAEYAARARRIVQARSRKGGKDGRGRFPKLPALAVTEIVVRAYEHMTGQNVALPDASAGLEALVGEVFSILRIEANPKAALAAVIG